jgi:uncharacterized membrane protein YcgQ (UPF0703/DUF1980 family)
MTFSFSRDFPIAFLFYFLQGFQFKFKPKFKFKLVQQFKGYFKLSMMQYFMTHIVLTKIYTILKAPVSTVVTHHLFTNKPSQLFQINPMHAYRWPNGGPAQTRRPQATTLAQARYAGLLTMSGQPVSPTTHLI